jgi:hypothetical protein
MQIHSSLDPFQAKLPLKVFLRVHAKDVAIFDRFASNDVDQRLQRRVEVQTARVQLRLTVAEQATEVVQKVSGTRMLQIDDNQIVGKARIDGHRTLGGEFVQLVAHFFAGALLRVALLLETLHGRDEQLVVDPAVVGAIHLGDFVGFVTHFRVVAVVVVVIGLGLTQISQRMAIQFTRQ